MKYSLILIKRMLEDLIIFPFILWGKWKARKQPLNKTYEVFFFFPFYHTGGAEKVHSLIANALKDKKALIVFTRRSQDTAFKKDFETAGHDIIDISSHTDHKERYWDNLIYRGVFAAYINAQQQPTLVFNGQSNFGYKLSRWISPSIPQIELIHSFSSFSYIRMPFLPFYRETVMISKRRIDDHLALYRRWGVPKSYDTRIRYIVNGIALTEPRPMAKTGVPTSMLFVGRGTVEKRPMVAAKLAKRLKDAGVNIRMGFVGDVSQAVSSTAFPQCTMYGNVSDPAVLGTMYREKADFLLVTSSEEGFPLVIMEAMARGAVVIATPVGDIPVHVKQGENGLVFSSIHDEESMFSESMAFIQSLQANPEQFSKISAKNIDYAYDNFGLPTFVMQYKTLIENHLR
jgi:glycosyltransferase involved in cell wall biosynthesis